jgi:hypothetical protein
MKQVSQLVNTNEHGIPEARSPRRLSFLEFLLRYPIFLLAFGPPIFRPMDKYTGFDTSQAHFDAWSVFQVGWLLLIAFRAILRLSATRSVLLPKQTGSILKYALFLGLTFLASVAYSPGRIISAEYSIIYFLTLICVLEFLVDAYRNPPDWMQCLFYLRLISLLLCAVILLCILIKPSLVLAGFRVLGGSVVKMDLICPVIAIISAYSFLHALESRVRSVLFFLVGLAGTLLSQSRGAEIPLLIVLAIICIGLAKTSKRSAYLFISGFMAFILLVGAIVGTVGAGRIWLVFNRGNTESFVEGSGRVDSAKVVIQYCMTHPLGMGYVTGLRSIEKLIPDQSSHMISNMGGADNSYMEVLADSGWLGLALYLLIIGETVALGWHFAKKHSLETLAPDREVHHAIRCALLLLFYCLVNGMDSSEYVLPLRAGFYVQNIILAIILGASASMLIASRTRYAFSAK